jgi:hypothetical protein
MERTTVNITTHNRFTFKKKGSTTIPTRTIMKSKPAYLRNLLIYVEYRLLYFQYTYANMVKKNGRNM